MGMSNLVALTILGTGAAALHAHGTLNIQTSAEAAAALRPVRGGLPRRSSAGAAIGCPIRISARVSASPRFMSASTARMVRKLLRRAQNASIRFSFAPALYSGGPQAAAQS
ncbi:hypothetical protein ACRAWG_16200 [Methylobacterium sp. P31]